MHHDLDELAEAGQQPSTDLADVRALATKQLELEAEVSKIESSLKDAKEQLRRVQENELPAALKAAGIGSFKLDNGMTVSYEEDLKVSVPRKHKTSVISIMRSWGYDAAVSNKLTADLGRGNDNAAKALLSAAEEMGVKASVEEDIPTATVKKALRTRIAQGKSDDLSIFGAFQFTKATVK